MTLIMSLCRLLSRECRPMTFFLGRNLVYGVHLNDWTLNQKILKTTKI